MTLRDRVAEVVRVERARQGWTLEQLAGQVGMSRQALSRRIDSGRWTYGELLELAEVLGVTMFELHGDNLTPVTTEP